MDGLDGSIGAASLLVNRRIGLGLWEVLPILGLGEAFCIIVW